MSYANGDVYQGEWMNDRKNGKGYYLYADGSLFKGQYNDNKRQGQGYLYDHENVITAHYYINGVEVKSLNQTVVDNDEKTREENDPILSLHQTAMKNPREINDRSARNKSKMIFQPIPTLYASTMNE